MKKYTKLIFKLFVVNIILLLIAFMYGVLGGSGGETTEGVFLIISYTGVFSIIMLFILGLINIKVFLKEWYWVLLILLISLLEIRLLI